MRLQTRSARVLSLVILGVVLNTVAGVAFVINNFWPDGDNIVMDNVLLPASPWGDNAEFQMSEWNEVDVTDNSHAFRVANSPEFSFGANDGDNTIGFLDEAGLNGEYGLSFSDALAWTVCWSGFFSGRYDECDVIFDVNRPWVIGPDDDEWFQSTALHELGHVRGLGHYNNFLSMQNSGTSKYLRNEVLYMDDKVGVRQNASHVSERDVVMYNKWHNGTTPQWMSMSPLSLREGQTINLNNITVENRGTLSFGSLRFGVYLSTNSSISTADTLLNTGSWGSFGTFTFSTFNWSATIPTVSDCGTRYIGGIIDDNGAYSERFEANNAVLFTNGVPFSGSSFVPTPLNISLRDDAFEPNDSRPAASLISLPFFNGNLSIDADFENDYFRFTTPGPGRISASAAFTHSLGNIDLQLLNSVGAVLATSAGFGNTESINFDVAAAGTYYVRAYGNGSGSCNKYSLNVSFAQKDLQVTILDAPVDAVPGQSISVANTVRNAGGLAAGSFRVGFYLSTDNICTTGDTFLASRVIPSLAAFTNHAVSTAMVIPAATSLGPKFICAYADDQFAQAESLETNNTRFDPISIVAKPDLVISAFVGPPSSSPAATIKVSSTVRNNGLLAAGAFRIGFYLSDDIRCIVGDTFLGSRIVAALGAGSIHTETTLLGIPAAATLGNKTLCAIADDQLLVPESIESNNTGSVPIQIVAPPP
jgi:hypothetical protein